MQTVAWYHQLAPYWSYKSLRLESSWVWWVVIHRWLVQLLSIFLPIFIFLVAQRGMVPVSLGQVLSGFQLSMLWVAGYAIVSQVSSWFTCTSLQSRPVLAKQYSLLVVGSVCLLLQLMLLTLSWNFPGLLIVAAVLGGISDQTVFQSLVNHFHQKKWFEKKWQEQKLPSFLSELLVVWLLIALGVVGQVAGIEIIMTLLMMASLGVLWMALRVPFGSYSPEVVQAELALTDTWRTTFLELNRWLLPVFLWDLLSRIDRIGYFFSLTSFLSLLVSYIGGLYLIHHRGWKVAMGLRLTQIISWLSRAVPLGFIAVIVSDVIDRVQSFGLHDDHSPVSKSRSVDKSGILKSPAIIISWLGIAALATFTPHFWSASWTGLGCLAAIHIIMKRKQ